MSNRSCYVNSSHRSTCLATNPIHKHKQITSRSQFKSCKPFRAPCIRSESNFSSFCCPASALTAQPAEKLVSEKLHRLTTEFRSLLQSIDRVKRLLHYATFLLPFPDSCRVNSNRILGCTAQVWLTVELDPFGKMKFMADSDSEITRGYCACLIWVLDGADPHEVLGMKTEDLALLNVGLQGGERSRVNTWHNVLNSMQKRTKMLVEEWEGRMKFEPFPSLVVTSEGIKAKGSFAEAQARYLFPDESKVQELVRVLKKKQIGIVAHFYMDPEVQGVLTAAQKYWPQIHISDSLVMADSAVKMAKDGCEFIAVLGVDFMSENVRAILDQTGFKNVRVYRMSNERIGCSLADAASSLNYMNYLKRASACFPSLHVIYINTSLETKASAHEIVPTITCTSSNVIQTILQAFAQIPDLNVWYGPDSYMGANISELFREMILMDDQQIAKIHPFHNGDSIRSILPRLHFFEEGACIVHHLFGHEVVKKINDLYCDAYLTAHLEVPGEMFALAMEAQKRGMGVVGSTQNILDFIKRKVVEALDRKASDHHLQFVLGTESGMITSIVATIVNLLKSMSPGRPNIKVEIIFPVSSDSITTTASTNSFLDQQSIKLNNFMLPIIPGVASGEGCSIHGGCASCPYMKMNSLDSLLKVCNHLVDEEHIVAAYEAERYRWQARNGKPIAGLGCEPILHMRHFQATGELPQDLVLQILHCSDSEETFKTKGIFDNLKTVLP